MPLFVHFSPKSTNRKLGGMPCSTSSSSTCAPACPLRRSGCYGHSWPLSYHWREVSAGRRGTDWTTFCSKIAALEDGVAWRHNVAGDLPHRHGVIDRQLLEELVAANDGKRGFCFTHHEPTNENLESIRSANQSGFCINLSANTLRHADHLASFGVAPVAVLVLPESDDPIETPEGRRVEICPAQTHEGVTCMECQACTDPIPGLIIGFEPHGSERRMAELIAMGWDREAD